LAGSVLGCGGAMDDPSDAEVRAAQDLQVRPQPVDRRGAVIRAAPIRAVNGVLPQQAPPPEALVDEVPRTDVAGRAGTTQRFTFTVPARATDVDIELVGSDNPDLFVKLGRTADAYHFDCSRAASHATESCAFARSPGGTYSIALVAHGPYANATLIASYTDPKESEVAGAGPCQRCSSPADCDPGDLCLASAAGQPGERFCTAPCVNAPSFCPTGTTCAELGDGTRVCQVDADTCR